MASSYIYCDKTFISQNLEKVYSLFPVFKERGYCVEDNHPEIGKKIISAPGT